MIQNISEVVVLKLKTGDEILAILTCTSTDSVEVAYPFYAYLSIEKNSVIMYPYCSLSDVTHYSFKREECQYIVLASQKVATEFLKVINKTPSTSPSSTLH
jgi:hypothetical protein